MPDVKALKCESCGAPLEPEEGQTVVKCPFCGTVNTIKPEPGEVSINIEPEGITEISIEEVRIIAPSASKASKSKVIIGLILTLILAAVPIVAAIAIAIAARIGGPNYYPLVAETRDGRVVAILYGGSKYHLGRINPNTGRLIWLKEFGRDYSVRELSVGEDRVYTSSDDGSVRCYDLMSGDLLWEKITRAIVYQDAGFFPLGNGLCFLGNDDTLRFFDREGKETLRRFCNSCASLTVQGGRIYLAQDTLVIAINPEDGKNLFVTDIGFYSKYMGSDESGIYILGRDYRAGKTCVAKINARTGSLLWQISSPSAYSYDSLIITNKVLYLLADSIASLNPNNGKMMGKFHEEAWEPLRIMPGKEVLYILLGRTRGITAYRLAAVDPGSLADKWEKDLQDTLVIVGDGVFLVDTAPGKARVRRLDGEVGRQIWAEDLDVNGSVYQMFLADNKLIIVSSGTVYSLKSENGKEAWRGIKK